MLVIWENLQTKNYDKINKMNGKIAIKKIESKNEPNKIASIFW